MNIPWITELEKVYGWHEVRDHDKLAKWLRSDGKTLGDPAKLPWCGDAADTALFLALPKEPRPGALGQNPYWALNWKLLGVPCAPCFGAFAAFERPGGGHIGVLVGQTATHYQVLGGNQGDTISRVLILKTRCKARRWPSTFANPLLPLPHVGNGPVSVNEK